MPLYTYTCENCGHQSDKLRKLEDRDSPIECGECESTMVRVTALPADPQFRGGGWTPKHFR